MFYLFGRYIDGYPISFKRFFKSITKAMGLVKANSLLLNSSGNERSVAANHIFIKVENKLVKIDFDKLLYLESFGEYVKFHTTEKMLFY